MIILYAISNQFIMLYNESTNLISNQVKFNSSRKVKQVNLFQFHSFFQMEIFLVQQQLIIFQHFSIKEIKVKKYKLSNQFQNRISSFNKYQIQFMHIIYKLNNRISYKNINKVYLTTIIVISANSYINHIYSFFQKGATRSVFTK